MEISELKNRLDILEVAGSLGIRVNMRTKRAHCPFHNDKTPSLQFSKDKQICTCFSSNCTAGTMDVISLTEKKLDVSTHEALKYLSALAGEIKTTQPTTSVTVNNTAILTKIFTYFTNGFTGRKDNKGRAYLQNRGLDIDKLESLGIQIGYNSAQFHHRGRISQEDMQACEQAGLLTKSSNGSKSENSYTPWAAYCVVFPLTDKNGTITGLYGRSTLDNAKGKHFYLKNSKGLFYRPEPETKKLIITESIIDFLSLYQIDELRKVYDFLPIYGTNRLNTEHTEAVSQLKKLNEIIFFLDGDKAGEKAISKYGAELQNTHSTLTISQVETPQGEDINSLLVGHSQEVFTHLIENRKPSSFLFSTEISTENKKEENNVATLILFTDNCSLNTENPHKLTYATPNAIYHIKGGLGKSLDNMKVTLEVEAVKTQGLASPYRKSRMKLDLYEDKQTTKAAREAGEKLGIRADLIEMDLSQLTDLLDEYREALAGQADKKEETGKVTIPLSEQQRCINFLKQQQLIQKFNQLIEKSGITGEENNRIFLFVIATAYKMPDTLHALVQGSSGSGKTYLSRQITDLMPKEDVIRLTRVTESSFYNYGEYELQHKLIVLEDVDGLKEEAEFAFRELQSNGEIISSTSTKDENNGTIRAQIKKVRGPIGSIATTTRGEIYEDNMSRIFLLAVDEGKEQTNRIIAYQNRRAAGGINKKEEMQTKAFIQNCIRMLKPYEVINSYADKILLPQEAHKIRRLTELYHAFINQVTLLNQYQRQRDGQGRLITQKEDIQTAIEIMFDSIILKIDELDGSLRQFYESLKQYIMSKGEEYQNYVFTQREIRQTLNIKKTRLSYYINELLELEYITQAGGYANRGFHYKITYWDNLQSLRDRIKQYLNDQVEKL